MEPIINPTSFFQSVTTYEAFKKNIDPMLFGFLPKEDTVLHKQVVDAMRYSYEVGGKRIRPLLMYGAYRLFADNYLQQVDNVTVQNVHKMNDDSAKKGCLNVPVEPGLVEAFMAAIEMIHTYSLIHDDLPAMDNDDLRRGKPTCHIRYGEANAILAGDGLLNYAFELVLKSGMNSSATGGTEASRILEAGYLLAQSSGIYGMIGGQAADMLFETNEMSSQEDLDYIHKHKTGAIITSSLSIGGLLGGATPSMLSKLETIGHRIGLSFQIQDDILDCTSTEAELGKPIGSDLKNNKKTYVTFKGLEQSQKDVEALLSDARRLVIELNQEIFDLHRASGITKGTFDESYPVSSGKEQFGNEQTLLIELIDFLAERRY